MITNAPILGYFNPNKPLVLETDASMNALGCCIMQDGHPIAYASKSLTKSETLYAQIEKELLGILFGCKRFHQFIYGREVTVHCDHKPISSIMKKPLSAAPPRLQRMLLQLQKYSITVQYVSGKEIPVSDCLSRHNVTETYQNLVEGLDYHVHSVRKQLFVTDKRLEIIKQEIKNDSEMRTLKQAILKGWPDTRSQCDPSILEYWNHRDEISYENDLIFRGQKLLIPRALRNEMIKQVHTSHLGVTKTLERAKDNLFWPGMTKQITQFVLECSVCLTHRDSNVKEPMMATEFPDRPYQKIGCDLFHLDGKDYLLTIDYYSRFFEIDLLPDTRSTTVIRKLQAHMSRNGICDILISDNGPQFASTDFQNFAKTWCFTHETSSPLHPKGNALAEKGVGIAKKLMTKAKHTGNNPYIVLLEYRNTPLDCGFTPAQLLLGRRTKSVIPISQKALKPKTVNHPNLAIKMKRSKDRQKQHYDKTSKPLKLLQTNDSVRVKFGKIWKPAKVIKIHNDRSYTVQTMDGSQYRRNRQLLHKTNENVTDIQSFDANILQNDNMSFSHNENSNESSKAQTLNQTSVQHDTNIMVTRSGRVVKPNSRYYGNEWSN